MMLTAVTLTPVMLTQTHNQLNVSNRKTISSEVITVADIGRVRKSQGIPFMQTPA